MLPEPREEPEGTLAEMTDAGAAAVFTFGSTSLSVRAALVEVRVVLAELAPDADAAGSIEIVLAEVLNNIGEHAYRGRAGGSIVLRIRDEGEMLHFETRDDGLPMPNGRMPAGRAARLDCPVEDIPEGGFGWHLIRNLTAGLCYARVGDCNQLTFRMRRDARPIGD
jgi:serine/threonine-protein kinase RsbW